MKKKNAKIPVINPSLCTKCNKCIGVCPQEAIAEHLNTSCEKCIKYCMSMHVPCSPEYIIFNYEKCDSCGMCIPACPNGAIHWFETETAPDEYGTGKHPRKKKNTIDG